jgi:3-deoxy-manno-octulosonate cytidylyltransferase (CMP-KDO synthetase)
MKFQVVIPARYASTRLPGKPLALIAGQPMVYWVWRAAVASGAEQVVVATDDPRIEEAVAGFGGEAMMTDPEHPSGTDRIAEVTRRKGWSDDTIVVNVQGDEPELPPENIRQVASLLADNDGFVMSSLYTDIAGEAEWRNPNVVKVVCAADGSALYFSRAPIPWSRDSGGYETGMAHRHVGIYGYRAGFIAKFASMTQGKLEGLERLEQLRVLEQGYGIVMAASKSPPAIGVDTPEDLEAVRKRFARAWGGN